MQFVAARRCGTQIYKNRLAMSFKAVVTSGPKDTRPFPRIAISNKLMLDMAVTVPQGK